MSAVLYERIPYFYGVYAIRHRETGTMYVGCTRDLRVRWEDHRWLLRNGKHNQPLLQEAWDACGEGAFELVMLEWVQEACGPNGPCPELYAAERRWLLELRAKGTPLYNKTFPRAKIAVLDETRPTGLTAAPADA